MIYVEKMADISGGGDPVLKWDYSQDFLHSFNTNVEFNYF